jgi:hypothetical protein
LFTFRIENENSLYIRGSARYRLLPQASVFGPY